MLKTKDYIYVTLITAIIIIYNFKIINLEDQNNFIDIKVTSLEKKLKYELNFEGKSLAQVLNLEPRFNEFLKDKIDSIGPYFFIYIDSIKCYGCFNFHMKKLKKINIPKIIFSNVDHNLISTSLSGKVHFINDIKNQLNVDNIMIALVSNEGIINCVDIADKNNYAKSNTFYKICSNFINR